MQKVTTEVLVEKNPVNPEPSSGFRLKRESRIPYLDGLRAYSIIVVILMHSLEHQNWLGPVSFLRPVVADGQLGVRVFFVLSGFLISTLLLDELEQNGKISIRGFYERRIARIFPAFYLYIGIIFVLTLFGVLSIYPATLAASATFTWNIFHTWRRVLPYDSVLGWRGFWHNASPGDDNLVLTHFWTLSLEEQFYVVWPSCLVLFGRRWSSRLALAGVILMPFYRLLSFHRIQLSGVREAVMIRSVQDLILFGVLAAFFVRAGALEKFRGHRLRAFFPWVAGVSVFVVAPWLGSFPSLGIGLSFVPTVQGLSVLLFIFWLLSGEGGFLRSLLESWPAVQLGLLSYSLYVWQQPFVAWTGWSWIRFPWNVLAPLPVAVLCYRFWELPMRRRIRAWFHQSVRAGV